MSLSATLSLIAKEIAKEIEKETMPKAKEMYQLTDTNNRPLFVQAGTVRLVRKNDSNKTVVTASGLGDCEVQEDPVAIATIAKLVGLTDVQGNTFFIPPNVKNIRGSGTGSLIYVPGIGTMSTREGPKDVADLIASMAE